MKLREHKSHNLLLSKVNVLIRFLIVSDMIIVGAMGMLAPLYALFISEVIPGIGALEIGLSISIYLVSRSILQIPLATLIDKIKGERDDYYFLVIFSLIMGLLHLSFLGVHTVSQLYFVQLLLGVSTAITYPSYMALFTRHIDKHMEGTEWGIYYTFVDLSSAALSAIGGYIASDFGYTNLVIVISMLCIFGALMLIPIKPYIQKR